MEDWLTQNSSTKSGYRIVERDQLSKVVRELEYVPPEDGNNVKLTLHSSYQAIAERAIAENVNDTRDVQEQKLVADDWLEDNRTLQTVTGTSIRCSWRNMGVLLFSTCRTVFLPWPTIPLMT